MPRRSRRGGKRQGQQGRVYSNRTDLLTNRAPSTQANVQRAPTQPTVNIPGQVYGQQTRQAQVQSSAPIPAQRTPEQLAQGFDFAAARQGLTPLDAESQSPDEPLTAGMAMGAGPGPEALPSFSRPSPIAQVLAELAASPFATDVVRKLAAEADRGI